MQLTCLLTVRLYVAQLNVVKCISPSLAFFLRAWSGLDNYAWHVESVSPLVLDVHIFPCFTRL